MFTPRAKELVKIAHDNNLMVIMSSHDFNDTPEMEELSKRFLSMKEMGCDIAKIACMPKDYKDVFINLIMIFVIGVLVVVLGTLIMMIKKKSDK